MDPFTIKLSLYVAIILYEKYKAIRKLNEKFLKNNFKNEQNQEKIKESLENIKNSQNLLLKAKDILQKELDTNNGIKLNETILKAITDVEILISNYS